MSARFSANISKALIREDMKRYWELPVLAFILFLFSSISPLMLCRDNDSESYAVVISEILDCSYPLNSVLLMIIPIISVMLVFSYLNSTGKVLVTHSQPFGRTAMISSHTVSAFLLSILPVIALGIVFLVIAHPVHSQENSAVNLFARVNVLKWVLEMVLCEIYVLAISIFAVVITGTSVHNLIAILGLNALVPLASAYVSAICEIIMYGYEGDMLNITWTHKLLTFDDKDTGLKEDFIFLAISIVLIVAAVLLYRKRRPERTLEGIVFRPLDVVLSILFVFAGAVPVGILFYEIQGSGFAGMIGFSAGSLICLMICRMIVLKSLRVLSGKTFKILGIYAVISAVLLGASLLDVFGFEDRIPKDADIVGVQVDMYGDSVFGRILEDPASYEMKYVDCSGEDVEKVRALHQMLLDHKDVWGEYDRGFNAKGLSDEQYREFGRDVFISFRYKDNKKNLLASRSYHVPYNAVLGSDKFGELFESESYRTAVAEMIPKSSDIIKASFMYQDFDVNETIGASVTDKDKLDELRNALIADFRSLDFEDFGRSVGKYNGIQLSIAYYSDGAQRKRLDEKLIPITGDFTNTLKWISENIRDPQIWLDRAAGHADKAVIYNIKNGRPNGYDHTGDAWYKEGDLALDKAYMIIDDKALLPEIYDVSSGLANVENTDSLLSGIYYVELLKYNSEWKNTDGGGQYSAMFQGYINRADLERITGNATGQD